MIVVITTLVATLFIQLGYFLWKLSAEHQPKIGHASWRSVAASLLTDWRWLLGLGSTIIGWMLFIQATALGEISLVQPLMSAGDVLLVLMAVVFLKERMNRAEWLGLALTVAGALALSWQAEAKPLIAPDVTSLLIAAAVLTIGGGVILYLGRRSSQRELPLAIVVGLAFGMGAALTEALTAQTQTGDNSLSLQTLTNPLLLGVVAFNIAGLILLQAAFQRGRASLIVPVQLALANLVTVAIGATVFAEHISPARAAGITLILLGAAMLHQHQGTPGRQALSE